MCSATSGEMCKAETSSEFAGAAILVNGHLVCDSHAARHQPTALCATLLCASRRALPLSCIAWSTRLGAAAALPCNAKPCMLHVGRGVKLYLSPTVGSSWIGLGAAALPCNCWFGRFNSVMKANKATWAGMSSGLPGNCWFGRFSSAIQS